MQRKRFIFDISTLLLARGTIGGIWRVVYELAIWARAHRNDVVFAIYEPEIDAFRPVHDQWNKLFWQGLADIDYSRRRKRIVSRVPLRDQLPDPLRELALWLYTPHRRATLAFEHWRLLTKSSSARALSGFNPFFFQPSCDVSYGMRTVSAAR